MQNSWRDPQDMQDLLSHMLKELGRLGRRAGGTSAADLLGPGMASRAIRIGDWNDPGTLLNGNYYSAPGALHGPETNLGWTGTTIARADGSGMQQVWNTDDLDNVRYWMRTYVPDFTGQGATFSAWRHFATPSGYVEYEHIDPTYTEHVQSQLDALEEGLNISASPLKVYRQATPPANPDSNGRSLMVGDQWHDTDDGSKPYIWDGDSWTNYADLVLGNIPIELSAAQATAEAAAAAAAEALDKFPITEVDIGEDAITAPHIGANAITAKHTITGAWIQTDASVSPNRTGIKMTSGGFVAYSPDHIPRVVIDAATGNITATGGMITASVIEGSTVTGGTYQTEAQAARGIKMNSSGFIAYGPSAANPAVHEAKLVIDAATGTIVLAGTLTGGGVITGPAFKTAATGARWELLTGGLANSLLGYTGHAEETAPGRLFSATSAVFGEGVFNNGVSVMLQAPTLADYQPSPFLLLGSNRIDPDTISASFWLRSPDGGQIWTGGQLGINAEDGIWDAQSTTAIAGTKMHSVVVMTNGDGVAGVPFPTPFPAGHIPVVVAWGGNGELVTLRNNEVNNSAFNVVCRNVQPGGLQVPLIANGPVRINYVAGLSR